MNGASSEARPASASPILIKSVPPKPLKPIRRQRRITLGVLDILLPIQDWMARVSWPAFARAKPRPCRSMWVDRKMAPSTVSERSHIATFFRPGQIRCIWPQKRTQAGACFPNKNFRTRGDTAGLALGLRFNVIILALLVLLVITSILATGFWVGNNSLVVTLRLLATLASVQISYLVGCLIAAHIPTQSQNGLRLGLAGLCTVNRQMTTLAFAPDAGAAPAGGRAVTSVETAGPRSCMKPCKKGCGPEKASLGCQTRRASFR